MPRAVDAEHSDVAVQPLELLEKNSFRVGGRLVQTLEGDAHAYFIAVDRTTGATGLYHHDQPPIDPSEAGGDDSALALEAPHELVVTDDTAVPQMIAGLQRIHDLACPRPLKQILTVLAIYPLATIGGWPDPRAARQVLDLLPSLGVRVWREHMRGMVAAAVAWLRAAMPPDAVKHWLDEWLKTTRQLGFTSSDAVNWYYAFDEELRNEKGKHGGAPGMFQLHRPDPSLSVTEAQAVKQASEILASARQMMNPAPLVGTRRERRVSKRIHKSPVD
jgi:hypothetical protein